MTLAFWDDEESQDGGTIQAGALNLTDADCGEGWLDTASGDPLGLFDEDYRIIPGTSVTRTCSFTLRVSGAVTGSLSLDSGPIALSPSVVGQSEDVNGDPVDVTDSTLKQELEYTATYSVSGTGGASGAIVEGTDKTFTFSDNGKVLTAKTTIALPFGTAVDNDSNSLLGDDDNVSLKAVLDAVTVSVTQTSS